MSLTTEKKLQKKSGKRENREDTDKGEKKISRQKGDYKVKYIGDSSRSAYETPI